MKWLAQSHKLWNRRACLIPRTKSTASLKPYVITEWASQICENKMAASEWKNIENSTSLLFSPVPWTLESGHRFPTTAPCSRHGRDCSVRAGGDRAHKVGQRLGKARCLLHESRARRGAPRGSPWFSAAHRAGALPAVKPLVGFFHVLVSGPLQSFVNYWGVPKSFCLCEI